MKIILQVFNLQDVSPMHHLIMLLLCIPTLDHVHHNFLQYVKYQLWKNKSPQPPDLLQPNSSLLSWQSFSPSHWKERGMHWSWEAHCHSLYLQGDPGGLAAHSISSVASPQSSSPSQRQVFRTHFLFSHWNSFGSHKLLSPRVAKKSRVVRRRRFVLPKHATV